MGRPASATKLDGRPYFTYDASPGGILEDHIAIVNFSTKPLKLERVHGGRAERAERRFRLCDGVGGA